jgi:hypothetical protein
MGSSSAQSFINLGGYSAAGNGSAQIKYDRSTGIFTIGNGSRDTIIERLRIDNAGQLSINTNGQSSIFSTRYGANSVGNNIWVGNGGSVAIGNAAATYMGSYNSSFGINSLFNNTTGFQNCAFGNSSLVNNTTGYYNSAFGQASLQSNMVGLGNCAFGINALLSSTNSTNSAFGFCSMQTTTTGYNNSAFGSVSLFENTTGHNNCAFGDSAGRYTNSGAVNQTSNTSIYIGADSRASANGNTNEIVIGNASRGNGSNTVTIGNSSTTNNIFYGTITASNIAGGAADNSLMKGRLNLVSNNPTEDVSGSATLYYTPYNGNRISLYDNVKNIWKIHTFTEISISLSGRANGVYDVFIYDNNGTKTLELTAWVDDLTRDSQPYTWTTNNNNYLQDGVYVKTGSTNKRYIGTVYIFSGSSRNDKQGRYVWNMYNRVDVIIDPNTYQAITWTYNSVIWRLLGGGINDPVDIVVGQDEDLIDITIGSLMSVPATTCFALLTLYVNDFQIAEGGTRGNNVGQNQLYANYKLRPAKIFSLGRLYFDVYEARAGTGIYTGFGGNGNLSYWGGILAKWRC